MADRFLSPKKNLDGSRQLRAQEVAVEHITADKGLSITNGTVGHANVKIAAGTFTSGTIANSSSGTTEGGSIKFSKQDYDTFGHGVAAPENGDELTASGGLCISDNTLQHTNKVTAGSFKTVLTANTVALPNGNFDKNGHFTSVGTDVKISFTSGLKSSSEGVVEHTNAVTGTTYNPVVVNNATSGTTVGGSIVTKKYTDDNQGHRNSDLSNDKTIGMDRGLSLFNGNIGHANSTTAGSTSVTIGTNKITVNPKNFDAQGHITTNATAQNIVLTNGLTMATNGTVSHTNSITASNNAITLAANTITFKQLGYDGQGHINSNTNGKVLTLKNGLKSDTSGNIEHSNSVTAQTTGYGSTTACISGLKWDAQGHITAGTVVTIYPPTVAGTSGQLWQSKGSGAGQWLSISTSVSASSTDAQVPSAKLFYTTCGTIEAALKAITSGSGV